MNENDQDLKNTKKPDRGPSEYVRLEAGLISKPVALEHIDDLKVDTYDPRTILILSSSLDKCDEAARELRTGLGRAAVIIPCINSVDAIKWINKGSIDLLLCGRETTLNPDEKHNLPLTRVTDSIYGAALVLIRKSDPSLIAWIQVPEHLHYLSVAIATLNEEF